MACDLFISITSQPRLWYGLKYYSPHAVNVFPPFVQDPRVLDAMLPYLCSYYGNPHSRTHAYGWESEAAVENARKVTTITMSTVKFY